MPREATPNLAWLGDMIHPERGNLFIPPFCITTQRGETVANIFALFFYNRSRSVAYQVRGGNRFWKWFAVYPQLTLVTDGQTDRQTDRETDK